MIYRESRLDGDEGNRMLIVDWMRHSEYRGFHHRWMSMQQSFDFRWRDLVPSILDEIF